MTLTISRPHRSLHGDIYLDGSKSISNRVLIIRALCNDFFEIKNLSTARDTQLMQQLLASNDETLDAGAAGTTFRFLTAFLATQPNHRTLTGSVRMKDRPIGILVEALRTLGCRIEYLEKEGYPPLRFFPSENVGKINTLSVPAGTSSQYLSALLMIAPTLPDGLHLRLEGSLVSRPYLDMTLRMMEFFGVSHTWLGSDIHVPAQRYQARDFSVEADWSAASYHYALAAFSEDCDLRLHGLHRKSWQGDAVLPELMKNFGVQTEFSENSIRLTKGGEVTPYFEQDFLHCPDLAQTLAVVCGGLGVGALFTGLDTLRIKETDRIAALQTELAKVGVFLSKLPARFSKISIREYYTLEGTADVTGSPVFQTYDDHRMAMSFAPLAMFGPVDIEHPAVVEKSYPRFWEDLKKLGFEMSPEF